MALPVVAVRFPAVLRGLANGKLPAAVLLDTPGRSAGPTVRLVAPAARAFRAMADAAARAGHVLKTTSLVDSYRPYDVQERVFRERYVTHSTGGATRTWLGRTWWQLPGTAAAAVPGTSNHGWGLALDIDNPPVAWLVAHAHEFGFSAELQSEEWHWRYFAGDTIPAAVLAYEEDDMAAPTVSEIWSAQMGTGDNRRTAAQLLVEARAAAVAGRAEVAALTAAVTQLAAAVNAGGGSVDAAAVLKGVDERLKAFRVEVEADTRDAVADAAEGGATAVRAG